MRPKVALITTSKIRIRDASIPSHAYCQLSRRNYRYRRYPRVLFREAYSCAIARTTRPRRGAASLRARLSERRVCARFRARSPRNQRTAPGVSVERKRNGVLSTPRFVRGSRNTSRMIPRSAKQRGMPRACTVCVPCVFREIFSPNWQKGKRKKRKERKL